MLDIRWCHAEEALQKWWSGAKIREGEPDRPPADMCEHWMNIHTAAIKMVIIFFGLLSAQIEWHFQFMSLVSRSFHVGCTLTMRYGQSGAMMNIQVSPNLFQAMSRSNIIHRQSLGEARLFLEHVCCAIFQSAPLSLSTGLKRWHLIKRIASASTSFIFTFNLLIMSCTPSKIKHSSVPLAYKITMTEFATKYARAAQPCNIRARTHACVYFSLYIFIVAFAYQTWLLNTVCDKHGTNANFALGQTTQHNH